MVPGHNGNLPLAENFYTVPSIWSGQHKLSNETCLQWKKNFVPYGPIIGLFRLTYTPVYMVSHWADHLRPLAPDLLQCGSIDIEYLPLSHFLMWSSTGGWLTSTGVRWACLLTEFSSWAVRVGLGNRVLLLLLSSCLIWLAQLDEGPTPVWGAVTVPCRRREMLVR